MRAARVTPSSGASNSNANAVRRLQREWTEVLRNPSKQWTAGPVSSENLYDWHFTLRGPSGTEFQGGLYHGRILFPHNYPFAPPSITFSTPNGRFEVHKKICLSMSSFHPEMWQPAWGARTIMEALRSFMPSPGEGAVGALDWPEEVRQKLAKVKAGRGIGEDGRRVEEETMEIEGWNVCSICGKSNREMLDPSVEEEDVLQPLPEGMTITRGEPLKKEEGKGKDEETGPLKEEVEEKPPAPSQQFGPSEKQTFALNGEAKELPILSSANSRAGTPPPWKATPPLLKSPKNSDKVLLTPQKLKKNFLETARSSLDEAALPQTGGLKRRHVEEGGGEGVEGRREAGGRAVSSWQIPNFRTIVTSLLFLLALLLLVDLLLHPPSPSGLSPPEGESPSRLSPPPLDSPSER